MRVRVTKRGTSHLEAVVIVNAPDGTSLNEIEQWTADNVGWNYVDDGADDYDDWPEAEEMDEDEDEEEDEALAITLVCIDGELEEAK
jgi:hypothetical protein